MNLEEKYESLRLQLFNLKMKQKLLILKLKNKTKIGGR